ncbi:hypothetical protein FQN51_008713 [Onygenales sp. PD_10]|nr:hypothetical protein FQN51_008713 [Onygenales sp. PD_10]
MKGNPRNDPTLSASVIGAAFLVSWHTIEASSPPIGSMLFMREELARLGCEPASEDLKKLYLNSVGPTKRMDIDKPQKLDTILKLHRKYTHEYLPSHASAIDMTDLSMVFRELGMTQYLPSFMDNGFETWNDVLEIREIDLDKMGVKLGHKRRLQQRVAKERNDLHGPPLQQTESGGYFKKKRRYQWHPKVRAPKAYSARPDPNAPKKPLTAYAVFANEKRAQLQYKGLSFPEMAIEIGKLWRELPEGEKRAAQADAIQAREGYKRALAEYEKSENHYKYERYLDEWKAKKCARKKANEGFVEKKYQSNNSSPQYAARSPALMVDTTGSPLAHRICEDGLNSVIPDPWPSPASCRLMGHVPDAFEWSLTQKNIDNEAGGEQFFGNGAILGNVEACANVNSRVLFEDPRECNTYWSQR